MKRNVLLWIGLGCTYLSVAAQQIEMVTTTATERWKGQKVKVLKNDGQKADVYVYTDSLMQEVDGFGGTFNELGWDALQCLDAEEVEKSWKPCLLKKA